MNNTEFSGVTLEEMVGDPKKAALLIVDMQNDFCHSEGALAKRGSNVAMIQQMAPRLRELLRQSREAGLRVIHIRTHHSPWTNSKPWTHRKNGDSRRCFPGSWGADWYEGFEPVLGEEWTPDSHEYVVTKHRYSGFLDTDLDLILRSHGIESLIMTGEATNVCVESTARDGYMNDYFIVFVDDCTATGSEEEHQATLTNMRKHFGLVVQADDVAAVWRQAGILKEAVTV
ncbi:MAG: cysteine hydrolase [Chloroflexi bacterium]|nr:cysteine hydrolase [Chloroflexota bacterium]